MTTPFTVYVMQSAHTDIGYTHAQEQIGLMYLDHYDRVLELCRLSADAPEEARFKWTCETAWQVRHYLESRPEREEEFLRYARAGQIEVTAAYLHFTDLIDADAYQRSLDWVVDYCRDHGLPLRCAMHADINGWPWAVADILAERGIPFFCSHVHIDSATDPLGRRGSVHYHWTRENGLPVRPDAPIRIPQAFWWQGPAGGRVLHWLNEHYHLGNVLGLSSDRQFGADKTRYFTEVDRATPDEIYAVAKRELPAYVERLRAEGYPYEALLAGTGGFFVDNAPPDDRWCAVIARWNREHEDIRLRTATLGEWYDWLRAQDSGAWPTRAVAWPDHWAHGLGSMTARIAQARRTQRRRAGAIALVRHAGLERARAHLDLALEQERLALEHTFNAWCTTARPGSAINDFQQGAKELTFHRAELYLNEAVGSALRAVTASGDAPMLYVPDDGDGAGMVRVVHFDAGDTRPDPWQQQLTGIDGQVYPFQFDREGLSQFVAALPTMGVGLNGFRLNSREAHGDGPPEALVPSCVSDVVDPVTGDPAVGSGMPVAQQIRPDASAPSPARATGTTLESAGWRLQVDPHTGGLASLVERATGREWVGDGGEWAFGQLVHEAVTHPLGREAVGNTARLIALGVASDALRERFLDLPIVEHTAVAFSTAPRTVSGPVFDAIELEGEGATIGRLRVSWRLYHALPLVELALDWDKRWSELPEAAYVAFPFDAAGGGLELETGGGPFQPGSHAAGGQLPGTCSSYYTIQRAASIAASDGAALCWLPLDAPLVMPNRIDYNNWETDEWTWNGFLASMPVNHYWHTNFPTSQRGPLRLRYRLISPQSFADGEAAIRAAWPVEALGWR